MTTTVSSCDSEVRGARPRVSRAETEARSTTDSPLECAPRLELMALAGLPIVEEGDDIAATICGALDCNTLQLRSGDVVVVTSKVISRAEGRFVDLSTVSVSERAAQLAATIGKEARLVELILRESSAVSRMAPGVLIVRHRLGFVSANAGIDESNARPASAPRGSGPWVLLLPHAPDATAARLRRQLEARYSPGIGVVITDSFGRPFRLGTVGTAIGVSGLPALGDLRGRVDLFGRPLERTVIALADQVAAAADLLAGQAGEGRGVVLVRGLSFSPQASSAHALLRQPEEDLYA